MTNNIHHTTPMLEGADRNARREAITLGEHHAAQGLPQWDSAQLRDELGVDSRIAYGLYSSAYKRSI
jgi:hypothetical protein